MVSRRAFCASLALPARARTVRRLAVTLDDVAWRAIPEAYAATADERLRSALAQTRTQAVLIAVGANVDNQAGQSILRAWGAAGHVIANHTYSHRSYHEQSVTPAWFIADVQRAEQILSPLPQARRWFRFPALKEGNTREKRDTMRAFLREQGYRHGHVTIDTSDWYFDQRLRRKLAADSGFDVQRYRAPYLASILERASFYDTLSRKVLGRDVPHTLLLHYNLLNALFLGDLLTLLRREDWVLVNVEEALADPVYQRTPATLPAGESLIWALAKETGRFEHELPYPGEDETREKPRLDRLGL